MKHQCAVVTRLVAHSALRDLVGAAARWVQEFEEEVEEENPFLQRPANCILSGPAQ